MLCSFIVNEDVGFYKNIYKKIYCKKPILTFDKIAVSSYVSDFKHVFYESNNRRLQDKSIFSYKRANRIYWIKWVLQNHDAELYIGYNSKTKSYVNSRRVAVCVDNYAVIIEIHKEDKTKAKLVTSYVADGINEKGQKAIDLIKGGPKWIS